MINQDKWISSLPKANIKFNDSINLSQWEAANKILGNLYLKSKDTEKYRQLEIKYDELRVSFDKGCYRGQEIVARMHYRAKKLPRLLTKSIDKNETISSEVFDEEGKKIGSLLSTAQELDTTLCLLSMNKNYEDVIITFERS